MMQTPVRIRSRTVVYLVLMGLTVATWAIGRAGLEGLGVSLLVLAFALLKGQLVGDWFMGLRGVRGIWRWVIVIWLVVPGALITLAFVLSERGV
ncbi:MAG: cytochrome C oxidase subunit IV family protein [Chromatiales bacterium]|jgi:hypothetical protein|nr:cytochrome C oxidase subunit IV family protein [Chromatiales bacterium]MDX9767278.1 cytochrome C oxidase subunit IV family protein [Ectothiorhodospiraceae bacterium]